MGWQDAPIVSPIPGVDPALAESMIADDKAGKTIDVKIGADGKQIFNWQSAPIVTSKTKISPTPVNVVPEQKGIAVGDLMPGTIGAAEAGAQIATSSIATPIAGLSGLGAAIAKAFGLTDADPTEIIKKVQGALTYHPESDVANSAVSIVSKPFELLAEGGDKAGQKIVDLTKDTIGNEAAATLGTSVSTGIQSLPLVAGKVLKSAKGGIDKVMSKSDSANIVKNQQAADSIRIINQSKEAGYTLPPSEVNPSIANRALEGGSGKLKIAQRGAIKNQPITNDLIRKDIGLAEDVPATNESLSAIRANAGSAYDAIKQVGTITNDAKYFEDIKNITRSFDTAAESYKGVANPVADVVKQISVETATAPAAIEMVKILRNKADVAYVGGDAPLGKSYKAAAQAIDDSLNRYLQREAEFFNDASMSDAVAKYQAAREQIAKTYTAEKALRPGGNFDASVYAKELAKGRPLTGNAKIVAEFASKFGRVAKIPEKIGGDTLLGLGDIGLAAVRSVAGAAGVGAAHMAGHGMTGGAVAAALLARPATRSLLTSKLYQNAMVNPVMSGPGIGRRSLSTLADIQSQPIVSLAELSAERRE